MTENPRASETAVESLPLDALCDRIVADTHARAHAAVPRIRGRLAALAAREPRSAAPALHQAFAALADRLLAHLAKEENILFPALTALAEADRAGRSRPPLAFPTVLHPIRVLESEHVQLTAGLETIETIVRGAGQPAADDEAWRVVLNDLAKFGAELVAHVTFEAEVLFPLALELDRRV
jgi:regulator of cell morphogenesis and NO signaling